MKKRPLALIFLLLLFLCFVSLMPLLHSDTQTTSSLPRALPLENQGTGSDPSDPYPLQLDTFYGDQWENALNITGDVFYISFEAQANEIYYIYYKSEMFWDIELYDDPEYSVLLGTSYPLSLKEYLIFSPNRTDTYYAILFRVIPFSGVTIAILTGKNYNINTTELVIIGTTHPTHFFQVDLETGNYTCSYAAIYAIVERGWNYVVFEEAYGQFPKDILFSLEAGSYGIVIEESCEFCLTHYLPQNTTPPDDPPNNSTDPEDTSMDILDGLTPAFGVGILVGVFVLYKIKKK